VKINIVGRACVLLITALCSSCVLATPPVDDPGIPLVRLISLPERFESHVITTSGYFYRGADGRFALYLNEGAARAGLYGDAVIVSVADELVRTAVESECRDGCFAFIAGKFVSNHSLRGAYSGIIRPVFDFRVYPLVRHVEEIDQ
jgi:hypothetical protein